MRGWVGLILVLSLGGCGTIFNMGAGPCAINDGYPHIYGGVCIDVGTFAPQLLPLGILMALIDLPFTLVGDTLTLPWSITATIEHGRPPRGTGVAKNTPSAPVVDTLPTSWPQQVRDLVILGDRYYEEATQHLRQSDPVTNPRDWAGELDKARELYIKANEECYLPASEAFKAGEVPEQLLERIRETYFRIPRPRSPRRPIQPK